MTSTNGNGIALDVRGLWAGYGQRVILHDVTFQALAGEIMGVIGANGSGKSTLFKAILGIVPPWRGEVRIFGQPSEGARRLAGYMPQIEQVDWDFPVTVADVALMGRYGGLGLLRRPTRQDREAAEAALAQAGMADLRRRLIGELSGGQRRRVLLARALAGRPKLLLLDEPMAGLDAPAQHQFLDIVRSLKAQGVTVVMSTHDLSCVSTACDCACCIRGSVVAIGKPEQVLTEEVLGETFGQHLLTVHVDGKVYAYQHHAHAPEKGRESGGA